MAEYSAGTAGEAGTDGRDGVPGFPGNDGDDGFTGVPGAAGVQGEQGIQGDPGAPGGGGGASGPPGMVGEDGDPGMFVPPGPSHDQLHAVQHSTGFPDGIEARDLGGLGGGGSLPVLRSDGLEVFWGAVPGQIPQGSPGVAGEDGEPGMVLPGPTGPKGDTGAPGGGGGSATTIEQNLSATPVLQGKFTIADGTITGTSKVLVWQAPGPYTGKGTRADEAELAPVHVVAVEPAAGTCVVKWRSVQGFTQTPMAESRWAVGALLKDPATMLRSSTKPLGRVRGNVKFSYLVFA